MRLPPAAAKQWRSCTVWPGVSARSDSACVCMVCVSKWVCMWVWAWVSGRGSDASMCVGVGVGLMDAQGTWRIGDSHSVHWPIHSTSARAHEYGSIIECKGWRPEPTTFVSSSISALSGFWNFSSRGLSLSPVVSFCLPPSNSMR